MISDREKFLMQQAMDAAEYYPDLDSWINEIIAEGGYTVEQHLSFDADQHALSKLTELSQSIGMYDS